MIGEVWELRVPGFSVVLLVLHREPDSSGYRCLVLDSSDEKRCAAGDLRAWEPQSKEDVTWLIAERLT